MKLKPSATLLLFIFFSSSVLISCNKKSDEMPKEINSISITSGTIVYEASELNIIRRADSIYLTVPAGTDVTTLIPNINFTGEKIEPGTGISRDFTNPVAYTITAGDGSTKKFVIAVKFGPVPDLIFIGSRDVENIHKFLYAINPTDGTVKWKTEGTAAFRSSPTYQNGLVYTSSTDGKVYAIDRANGKVKWQFKAGSSVGTSILYNEGLVYFGSYDQKFYAVNAGTGALAWSYTANGGVASSPSVAGDLVFFGCNDHNVYALNKRNGQVVWFRTLNSSPGLSGATYDNGTIYIGVVKNTLYAIDASNGTVKWNYNTQTNLDLSTAVVRDGIVYIAGGLAQPSPGGVFAIRSTDGTLVWRALPNTPFQSTVSISGNRIFIPSDDGQFYAINLSNGNKIWQKSMYANSAMATVYKDVVYIGAGDLFAFNVADGSEKWRSPIPTGGLTTDALYVTSDGQVIKGGE